MAQSLVKVYLHIIFHIKTTSVTIKEEHIGKMHAYMLGIERQLTTYGLCAGGTQNHVHLLCTLPKNIMVPDLIQKLKVASHKYLETLAPDYYHGFAWQSGYGVFSVSPSVLDNVVRYINNQPEHHRHHTFEEEYRRFMAEYKVEGIDERYLFSD